MMVDERPILSAYDRDIPAEIARVAVFAIDIGLNVDDERSETDKHVPGCEGGAFLIQSSNHVAETLLN
jgi:hypothetical protein